MDSNFQDRVSGWMIDCFGEEIARDKTERADRFVEEALELAQSIGWTKDRAHALVEYVFSRPVGEPRQEVGGVMVTLAALCNVETISINGEAQRELDRITTPEMIEKIRAKQASKPTGSALPAAVYAEQRPLYARYRNHRGETAIRTIVPVHAHYGSTEWHQEPQWLLTAYDLDRKALRDFALSDLNWPSHPHEVVRMIAATAEDIASAAGVASSETAGVIVSFLWSRPSLLPPFMVGQLSVVDTGMLDHHNGVLSWYGQDGNIYQPDPTKARYSAPAAEIEGRP